MSETHSIQTGVKAWPTDEHGNPINGGNPPVQVEVNPYFSILESTLQKGHIHHNLLESNLDKSHAIIRLPVTRVSSLPLALQKDNAASSLQKRGITKVTYVTDVNGLALNIEFDAKKVTGNAADVEKAAKLLVDGLQQVSRPDLAGNDRLAYARGLNHGTEKPGHVR